MEAMTKVQSWGMAIIFLIACSFQPHTPRMNKVKIVYVYDAICGWCFGFGPTMAKLKAHYQEQVDFEIISGGLKTGRHAGPIDIVAPYIKTSYTQVERTCGVKFGQAFVHGSLQKGTMVLNSVPPAIALCIMRERYPEKAFEFAGLLHHMYYVDGIEPENIEAYGQYAARLGFDAVEFNALMKEERYIQKAYEDFEYARLLGASSFPTLIVAHQGKRTVLFVGYLPFEKAQRLIDNVLMSAK